MGDVVNEGAYISFADIVNLRFHFRICSNKFTIPNLNLSCLIGLRRKKGENAFELITQ